VSANADEQMETLGDGITENLIFSFSKLPRLRVMARSTMFTYKGKQVDPQQVGRELKVRGVLAGNLSLQDGVLILRLELAQTSDGSQLWSAQYRRNLSDLVNVQAEIARQVSEHLNLSLTPEEQKRLGRRPTDNVEAYQLYLKGRYFLGKYTEEGFRKAINYFTQAIDQDPDYALAHTGIADAYYLMSNLYLPPQEAMPKARAAAMRALQIDETLGEAHASLALVKSQYDHDFVEAEREYKRAIELNPSYAQAHLYYGIFFIYMERPDEARREFQLALELDPLSSSNAITATWPYYYAPPSERNYDRVLEEARKLAALDPNFPPAHAVLSQAYSGKGMHREAIAAARQMRQLDDGWGSVYTLGIAHAAAGERDEALKLLAELRERSKREHISAFGLAAIHIYLGEKDRAFELLREACAQRDEQLLALKVDPYLDSLRADPRFAELVRCMGLSP
jgi:serine/threonine-protein kinase